MDIYNKRDEYLFSPFFPYSEVNATVHESISQNANWALYSEAKSEDFTLIWARIAALFANKATPRTLNRVTGVILVVLGIAVMCFHLLA